MPNPSPVGQNTTVVTPSSIHTDSPRCPAAFETDVDGKQAQSVKRLLDEFPFGSQLESRFDDELKREKLDFERDVKPVLGNEFVVGSTDAKSFVDGEEDDDFVGAVQAADQDKLDALIEKSKAKESGEHGGAKLYKDEDGDEFAVDEGTLVVAGSRKLLTAALDRHDGDDKLTLETFNGSFEGLPQDALVKVYADVEGALAADPDTEQARKVKWVGALRTFGATASVSDAVASFDFKLATEGDLSEEDLPIAAGGESPPVLDKDGEIGVGIRDPAQLVAFFESAAQAADPQQFGQYNSGKEQLERQLKISLDDDILAQLEGDVATEVTVGGKFSVRAELDDPAAFKRTLVKLGRVLPKLIESSSGATVGYAAPKGGLDYFRLSFGGQSYVYGVVNRMFVLSNDSGRASRLSEERAADIEGAEGSLVMRADAQQLVSRLIPQLGMLGSGGALGGALLSGSLGELTGSVSAETDGLKGRVRLGFD